jgi:hypothetical protein
MQERNQENTQPLFRKKNTTNHPLLNTMVKKLIRTVAMIAKANVAAHPKMK